jgi:hypothetical protein
MSLQEGSVVPNHQFFRPRRFVAFEFYPRPPAPPRITLSAATVTRPTRAYYGTGQADAQAMREVLANRVQPISARSVSRPSR